MWRGECGAAQGGADDTGVCVGINLTKVGNEVGFIVEGCSKSLGAAHNIPTK